MSSNFNKYYLVYLQFFVHFVHTMSSVLTILRLYYLLSHSLKSQKIEPFGSVSAGNTLATA